MAKRQKTPLDEVTSRLGQLDRSELEELQDIVARFLTALAPEEETGDDELDELEEAKTNGRVAKGHIEEKTINGYGPYLYLRYWQGKTLKSKYLGKKQE